MKIPEIQYKPGEVSSNVSAVEQVDVTSAMRENQQQTINDMQSRLSQMQRNSQTRLNNMQTEAFPYEKLAQFSQKLTGIVDAKAKEMDAELEREMTQLAFMDKMQPSEAFNEQEAKADAQGKQESSATDAYARSTGDIEGANRMASLNPRERMHYAKAILQQGASGYGTFIRENAGREFNIGGNSVSLTTGSAEERAAIQSLLTSEFLEPYRGYNKNFLAKYMFPTMYKQAEKESEFFTKQANFRASSEREIVLNTEFNSGSITVQEYLKGISSTTDRQGNFRTPGYALDQLVDMANNGALPMDRIVSWGDEINPMTKRPWKDSPRWAEAMGGAQTFRLNKQKETRSGQKLQLTEFFNEIDGTDPAQINALAEDLIEAGNPADLVWSAAETARSNSVDTLRQREIVDGINRGLPEFIDPATGFIRDDIAYEMDYSTRQQFSALLSPQAKGANIQKDFLNGQGGKDLKKDVRGLIQSTYSDAGITLELENALTGQTGPANQAAYETEVRNWIVNYASELMVNPKDGNAPANMDEAVQIAKDKWRELTSNGIKLKPDLYFNNGQFVMKGASNINNNAVDQATFFTMHTALTDKDLEGPGTQGFSPAVMQLSRRFGKSPEAIVRMARTTKGLEPSPVTPREASIAAIPETDQARLNSVTDPSTQSRLRAQLRSGQALQGTPEQRSVAVGRQLQSMGFKGIWQNKYFNYENGYTPTGGQRVWQRPYDSKHNTNQALDIGVNGNGEAKLDMLYKYLSVNKKKFGIRLILWRTEGHYDHLHVDFE
jgi:hypothetical protein